MSDSDYQWGQRVRGLVLGLALGDTIGNARGSLPATGPLRAGVSTQLAAFTIEGAIRAYMRGLHKGICHEPSVVWHAYCRWAAVQGIDPEGIRRQWADGTQGGWPDGWLHRVPALGERRGNAPATVAALRGLRQGTVDNPATNSRGCHALTRTLPLAALSHVDGMLTEYARDVAALTHGNDQAQAAAAVGVHLTAQALTSRTVDQAVNAIYGGAGRGPRDGADDRRGPGTAGCVEAPRTGELAASTGAGRDRARRAAGRPLRRIVLP